jgi:hypothetical protein
MVIDAEAQFDRRARKIEAPFPKIRLAIQIETNSSDEQIEKMKADLRRFCPLSKVIRNAGTEIEELWTALVLDRDCFLQWVPARDQLGPRADWADGAASAYCADFPLSSRPNARPYRPCFPGDQPGFAKYFSPTSPYVVAAGAQNHGSGAARCPGLALSESQPSLTVSSLAGEASARAFL